MIFFLKRNWSIFLTAIIFSILVILPRMIALHSVPDTDFKGIYPVFADDEGHYEARINSVINHGFLSGNPYIFEHKNDVFTQSFLPEWILSLLVKISGLSVPSVVILSLSIFLFFDFLLTYVFLLELTENNKISILYTSFFYLLFINTFGRPINPHVNFFFLLSGLLTGIYIYKANILNTKTVFLNLFMGIVCGISLFTTPYYWSALLLFYLSIVFFKIIINREFKKNMTSVLYFLSTFLVFFTFFVYFSFIASKQVGYFDSMLHLGLLDTHWPGAFTNIVIIIFPSTLFYLFRKNIDKIHFYLILIFLSNIVILNWQNLVTGIYVQFSSHYLVISFFYTITLLSILHKKIFIGRFYQFISKKIFLIFLLSCLLLIYLQGKEVILLISQRKELTELLELQKKQEVFDWFRSNTLKDSVVYSLGGDYDNFLPIYTQNKVYYNFYASIFPITNNEIENRWLISNFFNTSLNREFISKNHRWLWMNLFLDKYNFNKNREKILGLFKKDPKKSPMIDWYFVDNVYEKYLSIKDLGFNKALKMYKVDYVLLDSTYDNYSKVKTELSNTAQFTQLMNMDGVLIFSVN